MAPKSASFGDVAMVASVEGTTGVEVGDTRVTPSV